MKTSPTAHPFKMARKAGVPIMAINTADAKATIRGCAAARNGKPDAFLSWDCVRETTREKFAAIRTTLDGLIEEQGRKLDLSE